MPSLLIVLFIAYFNCVNIFLPEFRPELQEVCLRLPVPSEKENVLAEGERVHAQNLSEDEETHRIPHLPIPFAGLAGAENIFLLMGFILIFGTLIRVHILHRCPCSASPSAKIPRSYLWPL